MSEFMLEEHHLVALYPNFRVKMVKMHDLDAFICSSRAKNEDIVIKEK